MFEAADQGFWKQEVVETRHLASQKRWPAYCWPPPQTPNAWSAPSMRSGRIDGRNDRRPNSSRVAWPSPSSYCAESLDLPTMIKPRKIETEGMRKSNRALGKIDLSGLQEGKSTKAPKPFQNPRLTKGRPVRDAQLFNRSRMLLPKREQALQQPMPHQEFIAGSQPACPLPGRQPAGEQQARPSERPSEGPCPAQDCACGRVLPARV